MPALPNVSGAVKIQLGWQDIGDIGAMTVFHFAYTGGPPTSANCANMAEGIQGDAVLRFADLLNVGSSIGLVTVTDLSSDMGGEGTGGTISPGTRTGSAVAPGTAVVVSKHVPRHYRGGHPRSYLPLGVVADIVTGKWTSAFASDVHDAWVSFKGDVSGEGIGCVLTNEISVSYFHAGAIRTTPVKDVIDNYTVAELIGSQRRRNRKQ